MKDSNCSKLEIPIAIVGMEGSFPAAENLNKFWKNLVDGKDPITEVPKSRWNMDEYYDPYPLAPGKTNSRYGGFIAEPNDFNAHEFGIKPQIERSMDPQQKILLMVTKKLLDPQYHKKGKKTGVFIGGGNPEFLIQCMKNPILDYINPYSGVNMSDFTMLRRLTYQFGLEGPAVLVHTACSSSLVAVHQAIRALQSFDCDGAIAGGINYMLVPDIYVCLTKGGFLSPEGRCKTFDESANGYVRSEGCGLVFLKRIEDAVKNKDNILSIIYGSAINQDGIGVGFTTPNIHSQIRCYQEALKRAHVDPSQINYIEAHGTGTQLGDVIEIESIRAVYDQNRSLNNPLYIGAVKSTIGHCESAAGIAGLIKTVQVLQHQKIPRNLHFHLLNRAVTLENSSLILPTQTVNHKIEYASVSSFGVAGTNVHMILKKF